MRYQIHFLADGNRYSHILSAPTAAAAVELTQNNVTSMGRVFELLSVLPLVYEPANLHPRVVCATDARRSFHHA